MEGRRRAIRVADLAAELNLSMATVSRALNGSRAVRAEVAERVLDHARRRGYTPNWLARSLAAQSRTFVGFLVPDIRNTAYSIAADACSRLLGSQGYQLILAITEDDPDREYEALVSLAGAQVATIIAAPSAAITERARQVLAGLPVVEFNRTAGLASRGVFCADRRAFAEATEHVLALGHADIGYIGTTDSVSNGRERLEGVCGALAERGRELPSQRVRLRAPTQMNGHTAALELLRGADRPTALLVGSSNLSVGVARGVQELGIAVPDELSLIVYGDPEWSVLWHPGLTTIAVPYREMAQVVADLVVALLGEPGDGGTVAAADAGSPAGWHADQRAGECYWLPARLVARDSTAPPRARKER